MANGDGGLQMLVQPNVLQKRETFNIGLRYNLTQDSTNI